MWSKVLIGNTPVYVHDLAATFPTKLSCRQLLQNVFFPDEERPGLGCVSYWNDSTGTEVVESLLFLCSYLFVENAYWVQHSR